MTQGAGVSLLAAVVIVAVVAPLFTALPPTAEKYKAKDRIFRQTAYNKTRKSVTPKWGFFGTIFNLILEQTNETKSAYNQIYELVSNQFVDENAVTEATIATNGSTPAPKISRREFLKIIDRNLKGLARLRNIEWREAKKDTWANLRQYKDEIVGRKKKAKQAKS